MTKINVYGPEGQIIESTDLSQQPTYNDPNCTHPRVIEVPDDFVGATAYQCQVCMVGWLIKDKINGDK